MGGTRGSIVAPRAIAKGAVIGVFAPSSPFKSDRFERGLAVLRDLGYVPKLHPQLEAKRGFLAGSDGERLAAFHDLLDDPEVEAIIAARGGYGAHRLLSGADVDRIRKAQKPIVGFSDVCALHALIQRHAELGSIHGPVVTQLGELGGIDRARLEAVLSGQWTELRYPGDRPPIAPGRASGLLIGGCLSVIAPLIGTEFFYLPKDAILLLEDVGEAPYRVDRLLTHLRLAGILDRVGGVALGDFIDCDSPRDGEQSVEDVLEERLGDLGVPVLRSLSIGHGNRNLAIPLGARATIDAGENALVVHGW